MDNKQIALPLHYEEGSLISGTTLFRDREILEYAGMMGTLPANINLCCLKDARGCEMEMMGGDAHLQ